MNKEGLIYGLATLIIVVGATFQILHWPGASYLTLVTKITMLLVAAFAIYQNVKLKKELKVLKGKEDVNRKH